MKCRRAVSVKFNTSLVSSWSSARADHISNISSRSTMSHFQSLKKELQIFLGVLIVSLCTRSLLNSRPTLDANFHQTCRLFDGGRVLGGGSFRMPLEFLKTLRAFSDHGHSGLRLLSLSLLNNHVFYFKKYTNFIIISIYKNMSKRKEQDYSYLLQRVLAAPRDHFWPVRY